VPESLSLDSMILDFPLPFRPEELMYRKVEKLVYRKVEKPELKIYIECQYVNTIQYIFNAEIEIYFDLYGLFHWNITKYEFEIN